MMEHPKVVRWLHKVFNPPRQSELRGLEKLHAAGGVKGDEYKRRRAEAEKSNDMSYAQIYMVLAFVVACVVVVGVILIR